MQYDRIKQWHSVGYRAWSRPQFCPPQKSWVAWCPFIAPQFLSPFLPNPSDCRPGGPTLPSVSHWATNTQRNHCTIDRPTSGDDYAAVKQSLCSQMKVYQPLKQSTIHRHKYIQRKRAMSCIIIKQTTKQSIKAFAYRLVKAKGKGTVKPLWKYSMTQLRSVTCHMGSHSVTC